MPPLPPPILLPTPRHLTLSQSTALNPPISEQIDPKIAPPQGYRLQITPNRILLIAPDKPGLYYAHQTLLQLRRQYPESLPCLDVHDWPDFPDRGVMLDISRDKVPTMSTLLSLIDKLAEWKINHLQLYIEHTFAYAGHEEVWKNASPLTPAEIRELDAYCRARFIDFVPNQNSFGHMERWLTHPRYLPLAEAADGAETPWGFRWKGPFSLCPTDPASLDLLADLYDQLLPNFTSPRFNVGCDETFDIGQGHSKLECDQRGVHTVYLEFLKKVSRLVTKRNRRMMFWGDIILKHPESIPHIPEGAIALNWGYEAKHPFDQETNALKSAGVDFYVCPGTSSWCSIAGRTENMLANQLAAARSGLQNGAKGFLNTDWGDYGHHQYLPISYSGLAVGAAVSWCQESNPLTNPAPALNLHVFQDPSKILAQVALDLGNIYKRISDQIPNRSALFSILVPTSTHSDPMQGITLANIESTQAAIQSAIHSLPRATPNSPDANVVIDEFKNAARMLQHACHKAQHLLTTSPDKLGWVYPPTVFAPTPDALTNGLQEILTHHRRLWLSRNRPGGLEDSLSRLTKDSRD
jgi:hexosaminidase